MPRPRFNHMELTFPIGALDQRTRDDIAAFYGDVFGWDCHDTEILGQRAFFIRVDDGQFVLLAEHHEPMNRPAYDHLGLLVDTRAEVDDLLEQCKRHQEKDDRVEIKEYDDLVMPNLTVHAFYVRFLLPIHFDVQCWEHEEGAGPTHRWVYAPVG